ncbi:MAG TPA: M14 family metallocarboxypeptidase [Verrucomicrobiae bacterium]
MRKLGKNQGRYLGETIDIQAVLQNVEAAALKHGWAGESFHVHAHFRWLALRRPPNPATVPVRVYLSAGIHGDEPAGPLAVLRLIEEDRWPAAVELFVIPCLNPAAFLLNKRENTDGIDLNRDYRDTKSAEIRAHISWLDRQPPFDLYLCLHEDWESHGFYLYEQNPDQKPSLAEKMIAAVKPVCPVDLSEIIEGRPAHGGIIRPNILPQDRPDWPEAFYLISHKSRQGYTLEAPSDFALSTRVDALVAAVTAALEALTVVARLNPGSP